MQGNYNLPQNLFTSFIFSLVVDLATFLQLHALLIVEANLLNI